MELVTTNSDENIAKCQQLIRTSLPGSVVTVSPVSTDGSPIRQYDAVFVGWTRGYTKFDYNERVKDSNGKLTEDEVVKFPSALGTVDDAVVMRPNGQLEIVGIRSLRFKLQ